MDVFFQNILLPETLFSYVSGTMRGDYERPSRYIINILSSKLKNDNKINILYYISHTNLY